MVFREIREIRIRVKTYFDHDEPLLITSKGDLYKKKKSQKTQSMYTVHILDLGIEDEKGFSSIKNAA